MWSFYIRAHRAGDLNPGVWIHDVDTQETIVDTGALDVFPLSVEHKRTIEVAPEMLATLKTIAAWEPSAAPNEPGGMSIVDVIDMAAAAVAKATA